LNSNTSFYIDSNNLIPLETYYYRLRAFNDYGYSEFSDTLSFTLFDIELPDPPSLLNVSEIGPNKVKILWQDNSTNESGFIIKRAPYPSDNFDPIVSITENKSSYVDNQIISGETYYYVVNADYADSILSSEFNVNFRCELVKLSTGEVIGVFEQVDYNKNNTEKYGTQGYLVDCTGIEAGDYCLRLTTTVNEEVNLSLSDIQLDEVVLEKSNLVEKNFKGEEIPLEYALDQNYPNPFNPATTIRYQIPEDGMVTLKVYDILGSEVITLVSDEKPAGRYEVNFDATKLSSGIYLYRLQAGDFIKIKKMILLK
jgi:hypothetical protein